MNIITKNPRAAFVSLCVLCIILLVNTGIANSQDIKLIVRGDDMSMTQGSLVAFERAFNNGVLTSGGIAGCWALV